MSKKLLAILTAVLLIVSLCACDSNDTEESSSGDVIIINPNESEESSEADSESNSGTEDTSDEESSEAFNVLAGALTYIEQKDTVYIYNRNLALNIRDGEENAVASVANGTELQRIAVSEDGVWSKIIYNGEERYVVSNSVVNFDITEGFTEVNKTLTLKGNLWVRIVPFYNEGDHQIVGSINAGETVEIIAENIELGWYKISYDCSYEGDCFISANPDYYVEVETGESDTESSTETN